MGVLLFLSCFVCCFFVHLPYTCSRSRISLSHPSQLPKKGRVTITAMRHAFQGTMKRSTSIDDLLDRSPTKTSAEKCEWSTLKLRKRSEYTPTKNPSENAAKEGELQKVLRKPRSRSVGDLLDEKPKVQDETTSELRKILQKQKAVSERGRKSCELIILLFRNISYECI